MATRFKIVIALLAEVAVVATAACAGDPPVPTPNIDATIEAGITATMVGVAIKKGVKATMAAPAPPSVEHYNRADTYMAMGEYDNAIQEYDEAIHLDPGYADAYYNRGYACDKRCEYERAIQDFDQAIRLEPNEAVAYNDRGIAYHYLGEYQRAIQD